jgi:cell division transport system permease protein
MYDRIEFMLGETWEALTRNKLMTMAAITTAGVSLLLLGGFVALWYEIERQLATLPDRFEMRVFLRDDVTREEVAAVSARLHEMPELCSIRYVSREEGWSRFRQGVDAEVTADLPNPLPQSFIVKLRSLQQGDEAARRIRLMPEVDHDGVVYLREEQRQVAAFMRFVRGVGLAITGALLFSTGVLIFNTVRLTVLARRREIRVMKLVGASQSTIRTPFLLEAVAHGGAGGAAASVGLWFATKALSRFLPGFVPHPGEMAPFWVTVVALAGLGGAFGLVCGGAATRRFLGHEPVA